MQWHLTADQAGIASLRDDSYADLMRPGHDFLDFGDGSGQGDCLRALGETAAWFGQIARHVLSAGPHAVWPKDRGKACNDLVFGEGHNNSYAIKCRWELYR
ncbi:hypothetical protein GCM10011499_27200 [Pelagibacterium lentulum]|uniref:Uncharacterized protein n=1 Tax=Pelagibacterium lentulum TaxID=2029865 RepID=A0A916RGD8_9HYPH|nr:hypothetical protein GCM10011499_27200 [Pelagibacterium lentulum]